MTATSRLALALSIGATGTAVILSALTGLQRGGTLPERLVWVAVGILLVVSAHLLPALVRTAPLAVRGVAGVLWIGCMAGACYGHATFFLLAQRHAGELRANSVAPGSRIPAERSLTAVMAERASLTAQLAVIDAKRCTGDCRTLDSRRLMLTAKLDALTAEAGDVRRDEAERDRVTALRDTLRADPVTSRLAPLLDVTAARLDLLSGMSFAVVLEGVACLLWTIVLQPSPTSSIPVATLPVVTPVAAVTASADRAITTVTARDTTEVTGRRAAPQRRGMPASVASSTGTEVTDDELTRLAQAIAAGQVRATVSDIRRHMGCSQAKAATLRRQLTASKSAA